MHLTTYELRAILWHGVGYRTDGRMRGLVGTLTEAEQDSVGQGFDLLADLGPCPVRTQIR